MAPAATTAPLPTQAAAQKQQGGTLTIGTTEEPDTLQPLLTQLTASSHLIEGIFDGLLDYGPDQTLQAGLAETYTVSADGLTYTFLLRKGVRWHDGQPFTSADVKATWQIINNAAFSSFVTSGWDQIVALETPDDYTVIMKTDAAFAPFLSAVAPTPIVPKHIIDKGLDYFKQDFGRHPIGTGPFKFAQWESAQFVRLEKNAGYWGGSPYLDAIVFKVVPDINTLVLQLKTGDIQMTDNLSPALLDQIRSDGRFNLQLRNGTEWQHIDLKQLGFLTDKRVRQALDYAVPKQQIIDNLLKGLATVATGDQAPDTAWVNTQLNVRPYDLDQAAQLLSDAGFKKNSDGILEKNNTPFVLEYWVVAGDDTVKQIQEAIAENWRKLGISVDTRQEDSSTMFGPNGYQFTKKMTAGQYSWNNSNDPDDMFYWHSSEIPKNPAGSGGNTLGYFHRFSFQKEIDKLTESGTKEQRENMMTLFAP